MVTNVSVHDDWLLSHIILLTYLVCDYIGENEFLSDSQRSFDNFSSEECVCVFFPSILDIKFVGRTSRGHTGGRSHRIFNPPSFCGACLDFCREKDSAIPFPRRP